MSNVDILDLEYSSKGRDIDIVEPTLSYLELKYGLKIERRWLFHNPLWDLIRIRPKVLVIANSLGSFEHFCTVKFAHYLGIKVVTFVSEGDYYETKENVLTFFWGWNKDKRTYEDLNLQWSQRIIDLIHKYIPSEQRQNTTIRLSGATGFDKYKLLRFIDKKSFLKKYSLEKYTKVVGIAGWGFGHFFGEYYERFKDVYDYPPETIKIYRESLFRLREGYDFLIKNNPDILFILKYHPLTVNEEYSEFYGLKKYQNVLILHTEENIYDIISASDIWLAFESTTCLEGWLMGKTTLLYNPAGDNFTRSIISKGSYIVKEKKLLSSLVQDFFNIGHLECFENLSSQREYVIRQVIGYDDGRSFVRAAGFIKELFDNNAVKKQLNLWKLIPIFPILLKHSLRIFLCKYKVFHNIPWIKNKIIKGIEFRKGLFSYTERQSNANMYKSYLKKLNII